MIRLALTGSIGMGKSATAKMFAARGVPVYDADAAVHAAYAPGGEAVAPVEWAFPGSIGADGGIDRTGLRERVLRSADAMKKLESIIHPIVSGSQRAFLQKAEAKGADIVVLDIPLLFETGGDKRVDAIAVVTAPADLQRSRVLARQGMTEDEFETILARQVPDSVKRRKADFVINTGLGFAYAEAQVDAVLRALRWRDASPKSRGPVEEACAKSSSTQKQLASTPPKGTELSRSGALSS